MSKKWKPRSKALRLPFRPNKFQPLQHCDNIANYYADVLFALYADVRKEWNTSYHCIAKTGDITDYIRFSNDLKIATRNSPLQNTFGTVNSPKGLKKGTLIFSALSKNKTTVSDIAILFVYGGYQYQVITRYKNYFTTENSLGDKVKHKYSDGGLAGGSARTGMTKVENFRKISLTALMKKVSFADGRKLGQRSTSEKKQAAARANGMKTAIRYKAEITDSEWITEYEFDSGKKCFEFFDSNNGDYKIFNNYMAFKRAMDKNNGKYEYSANGTNIVISQI
jgi:hypothetical protein